MDKHFHFPLVTVGEGGSKVDWPKVSYQVNPALIGCDVVQILQSPVICQSTSNKNSARFNLHLECADLLQSYSTFVIHRMSTKGPPHFSIQINSQQ